MVLAPIAYRSQEFLLFQGLIDEPVFLIDFDQKPLSLLENPFVSDAFWNDNHEAVRLASLVCSYYIQKLLTQNLFTLNLYLQRDLYIIK